MTKIRGWRKRIVDKRRTEWSSEKGGYHVQVKEQDGTYLVTYGSLNNSRRFPTKAKAMRSAISYMKAHPNG